MFYLFANACTRTLLWLLTSTRVRGLENIPQEGPVIVLANHAHFIDPPILGAILTRKVVFMAKTELFRAPLLGWIVKHYDAFPVRRGEPDHAAMRQALKVLAEGGALGMFPEGTRSRTGALQRGHTGAALLALRSNAPVVPVAIAGTNRVLRWPNILLRPSVTVKIGPPFTLSVPASPLNREALEEATENMMRRLAALLPPDQRGVYAGTVEPAEPTQSLWMG
ncbi:MAG: 1-acyl-sn-glycerol-3-phosphate acyltransferase [Chloroflexi bacterium]|nr:1-acyl-sn-glycerol-3-phosphate acyltransferase [Chloroflexota bacterium]